MTFVINFGKEWVGMEIAILTGASSGLGMEFFKNLCDTEELDEIWLIARRGDRLEKMAAHSPVKCRCLSMDLTERDNLSLFEKLLKKIKPDIRVLINNAGFGIMENVDSFAWNKQVAMIDLNNSALVAMTALCLPYMNSGARVINISSIAAFAPNARMAVYSSTKAFVLSFSKALRLELKPKGINVLAVCPGPMDTEFLPVAGIAPGASKTFDRLPRNDPSKVAGTALRLSGKRGVYTPGIYKLYRFFAKVMPDGLVMKFSKV